MKTRLMNVVFLICGIASVFPANELFAKGAKVTSEDKSMFIGTSVYVAPGAKMTVAGNLEVKSSGNSSCLKNDGVIFMNSSSDATVTLPAGEIGSGEFNFSGSVNYGLSATFGAARLGILTMNVPEKTVSLSGDVTVSSKLNLNGGIVNVANSGVFWIDNPSSDAVSVKINTLINKSYVSGYLTRSVIAGKRYEFPVGNASAYHPFLVDKPSKSDVLSVLFDENVPAEINSNNANLSSNMINSVGWRVESASTEQNNFTPGLSFYNTGQEEFASQLEVVYLSDVEKTGSVMASMLEGGYVLGSEMKTVGLFALNQSVGIKLLNFLTVGNGNNTFFDIPNRSDYSTVTLKVYNSLGSLVFKSPQYNGEFDARDFPEGTYYYELKLVKDDKVTDIRRFIDINHGS